MIIPQLLGGGDSTSLGQIQQTEEGTMKAMGGTLPSPSAKVVPVSRIASDQQVLDYASAAHAIAKSNANATAPPTSQKWAEAAFWYWTAYKAVLERWAEPGGYRAWAISMLERGNASSDAARAMTPWAPTEPKSEMTSAVAPIQMVSQESGSAAKAMATTGEKASNLKWLLVAGAGMLLLGAVVTVVVIRKRRPRKTAAMRYAHA